MMQSSVGTGETIQVRNKIYKRVTYAILVTIIATLAYMVSSFDTALFGIALPSIASALHIAPSIAELAVSVATATGVAFVFLIGPLADRWGRRRLMQLVLLFTAIFSALTAIVASVAELIVVRSLAEVGFDNIGPSQALVAEESPKKIRGILMAIVQSGYNIGVGLGSILAGLLLPAHWRMLFVWVALPAILLVLVSFILRESPLFFEQLNVKRLQTTRKKYELAELFRGAFRRQAIIVTVFSVFVLTSFGAQIFFVSLYLSTVVRIPISSIATLLGLSGWMGVIALWVFGYLGDHFRPRLFLIGMPIIAGCSWLGFIVTSGSVMYYTVFLVIAMFFSGGIFSVYSRYVSESFPARMRGTALTFGIGFGNLALVIVPLVGSALFASHVPQLTFLIVGLCMIIGGLLMLWGRVIPPQKELVEVAGE